MSVSKLKIKYQTQFEFWKVLNLIIVALLLVACMFAIFFIYNNTNTALTNSTVIIDIKSNIRFDALDLNNYDEINKKIKQKQNSVFDLTNIRYIFDYGTQNTITPVSSTTSTTP